MGSKIGGGRSEKLSAWDRYKQNKQESQPESLDDDSLSRPKSSRNRNETADTNDLDDTFAPGSQYDDPTFGPGSKYDDPTHGKDSIWGGEPTFTTNSFGDPVQTQWNDIANPKDPLIGGPGMWGGNIPGLPMGRGPAPAAIRDMIDQNGKSKFDFIAGAPPRVDPAFFQVAEDGTSFRLKGEASASEAIKDLINAKPGEYGFECATAISVFAHVKAYREYQAEFGAQADTKFDQDFKGMQMGTWGNSTERLNLNSDPSRAGETPMTGEGYYFENNNVDYLGRKEGWSGENVVYAGPAVADGPVVDGQVKFKKGDALYFGHPFGLTNREGIVNELLNSGTRINPAAEGALAQAAAGASGSRRDELSSLLDDFRSASQLRQSNRGTLESLQEEFAANPGNFEALNQKFGAVLKQDPEIDMAEMAVADRAKIMLKDVEQELATVSRADRGRYLELRGLRDTLKDVVTNEAHISGYKQAPYR